VDQMRAIADAVLYEGYLLWPYRRSALKNQRRWTFGGVYPRSHSERREDDPWVMRSECLIEHEPAATVEVSVRFLHVVDRRVGRVTTGGVEEVDELTVAGRRHLTWQEAVEREIALPALGVDDLLAGQRLAISVPAGSEEEDLLDESGRRRGVLIRSWKQLEGSLEVAAAPAASGVARITVMVANVTPWDGTDREQALERTFCSTHAVLRARGGAFVSLTDPPPEMRDAAEACSNEGTWPVLVGAPGQRDTLLASPIILEDHPRIAPESPGDLFDGGEIDQMLVLNILSLTDDERAEMRDCDPRAREILERTEALSEEELMRLHGAIREFGMSRGR